MKGASLMAVTVISADNFQTEVQNAGKPVILDFWATWCPHCKRIAPVYEQIAAEYGDRMVVGKVDSDEEPGLAQKYNIEYLPTFVLLDKDGNVVDSVVAPAGKAALEEFISKNVEL